MLQPWKEEQSFCKEYEKEKSDTSFCAKFLEIVREVYGKDFDFSVCCIERGDGVDVVTFTKYPQDVVFYDRKEGETDEKEEVEES